MTKQKANVVKAEEAFNQASAGYELFGKELEPFSAMRQAAATNLGLRFGLVDESDIYRVTVETLKDKKMQKQDLPFYNQMFSDVVIVLWLCSVPTSRVLRALRRNDEAKSDAFDWADKNGLSITSEKYYQAAATFFQIMQAISTSTPVPRVGQGEEDEDEAIVDPNE